MVSGYIAGREREHRMLKMALKEERIEPRGG